MSAKIVQLRQRFQPSWGWSKSELGEFYRVEAVLIQAGLRIDTDNGISDEGDPWFVFCRGDDGEVIIHIARIGGVYLLASCSYEGIASGSDLSGMVRDLVRRHPLMQIAPRNKGSNIFLHPAALLTAIVATAFFKSTEVRAVNDAHKSEPRSGVAAGRSEVVWGGETHKTVLIDAAHTAVILYAIAEAVKCEAPTEVLSHNELFDDTAAISPEQAVSLNQLHLGHELAPSAIQIGETPAESPVSIEPVADALPLIILLWDLAKAPSETMVKNEGQSIFGLAGIEPAFVSLVLTIGLSEGSAPLLPTIQAAQISFAGPNGTAETNNVSEPHQLPAALLNALAASMHNVVEAQFHSATTSSFAITFIESLTSGSANNSTTVNPSGSSTISTTGQDIPTSTTGQDVPTSPANGVADVHLAEVQDIVQNFMATVSTWAIVETGRDVVLYDAVAVTTDAHQLTSVTFDFSDGSTLTLVGLSADLHYSPHVHV